MKNQHLSATLCLGLFLFALLGGQEEAKEDEAFRLSHFFSRPPQEVATLGAPTSGSLVEGAIGSIRKGSRHRFFCHSSRPDPGFLGVQESSNRLILKDQPGVFPAPILGAASITFEFHSQESTGSIVPVIVRPDGTIYQGLPMNRSNSPQTLVVSSPAQTGIYTLLTLSHSSDALKAPISVKASISTQPERSRTLLLRPLEKENPQPELISAEFIYTHSS